MWRELSDARHALGWGIVFLGYSAYLFVNRWAKNRRFRDETRARLILNGDANRRAEMIESEGLVD